MRFDLAPLEDLTYCALRQGIVLRDKEVACYETSFIVHPDKIVADSPVISVTCVQGTIELIELKKVR